MTIAITMIRTNTHTRTTAVHSRSTKDENDINTNNHKNKNEPNNKNDDNNKNNLPDNEKNKHKRQEQ